MEHFNELLRIHSTTSKFPLREDGNPYEVGDDIPTVDGVCMLCSGSGWYTYSLDHDWYTTACPCGALEKNRQRDNIHFASIPARYSDVHLKDLRYSVYMLQESKEKFIACCKVIKTWLDRFEEMSAKGKGLYLYSEERGSGKTMTAAGIGNELVSRGIRVKFATSLEIYNEIKRTFDKSTAEYSESQLLDSLSTAPVLIIDDFGTERSTDWQNEEMFSIVNSRYVNKKVTIFTSNVSPTSAKADRRITSRIEEMCYIIPFPGEDVRERITKESLNELMGGEA